MIIICDGIKHSRILEELKFPTSAHHTDSCDYTLDFATTDFNSGLKTRRKSASRYKAEVRIIN